MCPTLVPTTNVAAAYPNPEKNTSVSTATWYTTRADAAVGINHLT